MSELAAIAAREKKVIASHGIKAKALAPLSTELFSMNYMRDATPLEGEHAYAFDGDESVNSDNGSLGGSDNEMDKSISSGSNGSYGSNVAAYQTAKASMSKMLRKLV